MNANWKYDILFSFNVTFSGGLRSNDFKIIPSNSCRDQLKRHNLIFKSVENGGLVICEKRINPDTSIKPVWRINGLTPFTFILHLNNTALFPRIRPYSSDPSAVLPSFYGRKRHLYFDNLNIDLEPDQDLTDVPQTQMQGIDFKSLEIAANGTVSGQDLASLVPNNFIYKRENDINEITLQPLYPNAGGDLEYELSDKVPQVELNLTQSAYRFEQHGTSTTSEILFAASELLAASCFGIIQIYKDASIEYGTAIRYDIKFEES